MFTMLMPDGLVESVSLDQVHPSQIYCPDTDLWVMPAEEAQDAPV